jgi:hypothetical protein
MSDSFLDLNGIQVYEVSAHGSELRTRQDAVDLMSAASARRAALIVIPVDVSEMTSLSYAPTLSVRSPRSL